MTSLNEHSNHFYDTAIIHVPVYIGVAQGIKAISGVKSRYRDDAKRVELSFAASSDDNGLCKLAGATQNFEGSSSVLYTAKADRFLRLFGR